MQSTTRAMVANAAWVYDITLDPGSAIFTWAVEFSGQVVSGGTQGQGSFVDRSDEIVIGTTERVVEARTVHRMPAGQQGDARCAKSTSGAMATAAEAAEGEPLGMAMARMQCSDGSDPGSSSRRAEGLQSLRRSGAREVRALKRNHTVKHAAHASGKL